MDLFSIFWNKETTNSNPIYTIIIPTLTQIGFGGMVGFFSGYLLKKAGKIVGVLFALVFISIQVLIYYGYIPGVDWARLGKDITHVINKKNILTTLWDIIIHDIPFVASFIPFFILGLKKG